MLRNRLLRGAKRTFAHWVLQGMDDFVGVVPRLSPYRFGNLAALVSFFSAVLGPVMPCVAGPPFNTDFAEPTAYQHGEIDISGQGTRVVGDTSGSLPGIQADYGILPEFQARAAIPLNLDKSHQVRYGLGDVELGLKYRFLRTDADTWWPQAAFFPLILAPTGKRSDGLGQGRSTVSLPIWLQKNLGPWKIYGGGGYSLEIGPSGQDNWFFGTAVQRQMTPTLSLGGEIFHKEPSRLGAPPSTALNIGGSYDLSDRYHVYFSLGRGIQSARETNEFSAYAALAVTF